MLDFFRAGGYSMVIVLLFGLTCFVSAAIYAARQSERVLCFSRSMSRATLYASVSGVFACIGATMYAGATHTNPAELPALVMMGLGESMSPGILGFTLLTLSWMLLAIGSRRKNA